MTDVTTTWISSPISIDGNQKHLVVYLNYPYWNQQEEVESYSDQQFWDIFLVGPEKAKLSHHYGIRVIDSVKEVLKMNGITLRNIQYGVGFNTT